MRRRDFFAILPLLLAALPVAPGRAAAQNDPQPLRVGLIPELNIFEQKARYKLLGEYLSSKAGVPVRFTLLSRYGNVLDNFRSEGLDGAFFGSFTGALAIERMGVVPLARPVNLDGSSSYRGKILVRRDSGIRQGRDLRGKRMAFVDRAATAGYLFPLAWLRAQGISRIDQFFGEHYFTGSHDAAIDAVLGGEADAAAAKSSVYDRMRAVNPRLDRELLVLAESPPVPSNGLMVRSDLDPSLQRRLRQALLDLHQDPQGAMVLQRLGALRFIETTAADYLPVGALAREAGIDLRRYDYQNR